MRVCVALVLLLHVVLANAGTMEVLGQQITYADPDGYCAIGDSPRERELMDKGQRAMGPGVRLIHMAVRCPEHKAFLAGQRDYFDHWLQVQLLGPKGNFKRLEIGREAYLSGLSKASPRLDMAEINKRMRSVYDNEALSIGEPQIVPLGRDGNAVYVSLRMTLSGGAVSRQISGMGGMTLVNSLPLNFWIYEGAGDARSRERLPIELRQMLLSVLSGN